MNSSSQTPSSDAGDDQQPPCAEAVLAGTLALMTSHATCRCAERRLAMVGRIVSNMDLLARHPHLSSQFRRAAAQLQCHWILLGGSEGDPGQAQLAHRAPATLQ